MYVDQQKQLEDPLLLCCVVGDNSLYTLYICGLMTVLFVVNKGLEPLSPSEIPWTVHSRCLVFGGWLEVHRHSVVLPQLRLLLPFT